MDDQTLLEAARTARRAAYAPYSGYRVGAALRCADGTVFTGCNIENAAYPATICAERTALFKAVSEGQRAFSALAVVGGAGDAPGAPAFPCGVCRQALSEFCEDSLRILLAQADGTPEVHTLGELLPYSFSSAQLHPENNPDKGV